MASTVDILLTAKDEASAGIKGVSEVLGGLGSLAAGAVTAGLDAAAAGFRALGAGMQIAISAALENEKLQASLALTVKNANVAINEQNEAIEAAAGQFVSSTALSGEALDKLQDKLIHATAKLHDMEAAYLDNKNPTEMQTLALADQRKEVESLTAEIANGSRVITTSLIDALDLGVKHAGFTVESLNELAKSFQDLAGGSDDAILAIETIGLRAGTISAEEMPAFIQSVLDLGIVMGDTSTAATLLARAQEDPIAAMGRLQRAGVIFSADLKEQIKHLVDTGDAAGATALLMDRVAEATGGAAAANAATLSGQWEILKGRMGEAAENIGMALLPTLRDLFDNVIKPAIPIVEAIASAVAIFFGHILDGNILTAFNKLAQDIGAVFGPEAGKGVLAISNFFTGTLIPAFQNVVAFVVENFPTVQATVQTTLEKLQEQALLIIAALQPIIAAAINVASSFMQNMPMVVKTVQDMAAVVLAEINILAPTLIANVSDMLNQLAIFWRAHGDEIMYVIHVAWEFITVTVGGALVLITGIIDTAMNLINGNWSGAWKAITDTLTTFLNMALAIVGTNLDEFIVVWSTNWELAKLIVTTLWDQLKDAVAAKVMELTGGIQEAIINIVNWIREYVPQFVAAGADLLRGLISGAESMAQGLISAVLGPIEDSIGAAKALLGISSPSALFAGIGANMMQGMALGISGNAHLPAMATAGAAAGTVNNYYNLTAQYGGMQDAGTITQELRLQAKLNR